MATNPLKAAGGDGLPTVVWNEVCPVARDRALRLFQASLDDGELPSQWESAKIIPISRTKQRGLLNCQSMKTYLVTVNPREILEALVAERISFAAETFGLLPTNHFGARKRRSAN